MPSAIPGPITRFADLVEEARRLGPVKVAVAAAEDEHALEAIKLATQAGLVSQAVLVGDADQIAGLAEALDLDLSPHQVVEAPDDEGAARYAANLVWRGEAAVLMKGALATASLLKPVVALERTRDSVQKPLLSHVAVFEVPTYHKLLLVTDGGMVISPTLEEKVRIIGNAREVAAVLGIAVPKVAVLAAVETVNLKMPSTVEAHELVQMAKDGRLTGVLVDGPLALDGAISAVSAAYKGIEGPVAGDSDILLVPDIELGNSLGKSLIYFAQAKMAGLVVGGVAPIVLTSRSESPEGKLTSLALAVLYAGASR
jgi:phosphate butyryltransferase